MSILPEGKVNRVDLKTVCDKGEFKLSGYEHGQNIKSSLQRHNGEVTELISLSVEDIEASPANDYYLILDLIDTAPYIRNGRI